MDEFDKLQRLSVYLREESPEKIKEIALEIANQMISMISNEVRDIKFIRNIYLFLIMYSVMTKDLSLFTRIFSTLENLQLIYQDAVKLCSENQQIRNPILQSEFKKFFETNMKSVSIDQLAIARSIEYKKKFNIVFQEACIHVGSNYISESI